MAGVAVNITSTSIIANAVYTVYTVDLLIPVIKRLCMVAPSVATFVL
jgi:hypothetical protein